MHAHISLILIDLRKQIGDLKLELKEKEHVSKLYQSQEVKIEVQWNFLLTLGHVYKPYSYVHEKYTCACMYV